MTRIRVDPAILRQAAQQLSGIADRLRSLGSEAYQVTISAPSYEGQFGPKARAMGMEAEARLRAQADRLTALSEELVSRAAAFEAADQETQLLFGRLSQLLQDGIEEAEPILGQFAEITALPFHIIKRYIYQGSLINDEAGYLEGVSADDSAAILTPAASITTTPSQTLTPGPIETPTPAPIPIAPTPESTPTADDIQRQRIAWASEQRIKSQHVDEEYLETEPLEYVRNRVYWDNGIDYIQMAENKQNNILSLDFINDNSKYPGSVRAAMVGNMADEQCEEFLDALEMDPEHIPNYEPVYLEELTRRYSKEYKHALKYVDQERFKKVNILTDYFDEAFDGEYWEEFWKSFLAPGYE